MDTLQKQLLEEPGFLVATLVIAGLVLLVLGNQRAQRKLMRAGVIVAVIGLLLWGLATLVVTSREDLQRRTKALLAATTPLDLPALRALFLPEAVLTVRNSPLRLSVDETLSRLETNINQYKVSAHSIDQLDARTQGDSGETYLRIGTDVATEYWSGPVKTTWLLQWRRDESSDPRVWRIMSMEFVELQNNDPPPALMR